MEGTENRMGLDYNTSRETMKMPEYGRNVLKMIEHLSEIPDRAKRSEQAAAIVRTMEILNPQVRTHEDYRHKLWDQLFIISGFSLDIDSPYPCPVAEDFETSPMTLPMKDSRIKATHYGRNIEKIINLLCDEPEGEIKDALIHGLATYMRTQYLIWNKDFVADETIFADIEKLSEYRLKVPQGMTLSKINEDFSYNRPGIGVGQKQPKNRNHKNFKKKK